MPKLAKALSAIEVGRLEPGPKGRLVPVGEVAGLYLQLLASGGRSWILRTMVGGRRRDIGMGGFPEVKLAQARERAREAKDKIRQGIDPVEERKVARSALVAARKRGRTFTEAFKDYDAAKLTHLKNRKAEGAAIDRYVVPEIGDMLVADIAVQDVLRVLNQPVNDETLWLAVPTMGRMVRDRLDAFFIWAKVAGLRQGDNPAEWKGGLRELLPKQAGQVVKRPALALADAPAWMADLRKREGMGSRALEFAILTAARSGEVRGATWDEFHDLDGDSPMWIIPANRMKMQIEHRVPLPPAAVALLDALPRGNPLVFPAVRGGALSDMTLSAVMRRMHEAEVAEGRKGWLDPRSGRPAVPHGTARSTFRDWAAERGYDRDMAEIALAHQVGTEVERSYRRTDMLERRRAMMAAWSSFLTGSGESE